MHINVVRTALGRSRLLLLPASSYRSSRTPQQAALAGRVTEAGRGIPLAGVQVVVAGQRVRHR